MSAATSSEANQGTQNGLESAKREAAELAEAARERGREQLEAAKRRAAEETDRVAEAVDTTAERLESDGSEAIGGYGHSLAAMMRRLAGGLRDRDLDEFARELATFARRQPGAFIAGSVALGFGVSRFLKATSRREYEADEEYEADGSNDAVDASYGTHPESHAGDPDGQGGDAGGSAGRTELENASEPVTRRPQGDPTHNGGAL